MKRYDTYKDSGVQWLGEILGHWGCVRLKNIGNCQNGVSKGGDYLGEGFPFVSYSDAYKNIVLPTKIQGLAVSTEDDRIAYSVEKGDVLFTRTSETIDEIGFASTCLETIKDFNDTYGNIEWKNRDEVQRQIEELPARIATSVDFANAVRNGDRQVAQITFNDYIINIVAAMLEEKTEFVQTYFANPDFQNFVNARVFQAAVSQLSGQSI